MSYCTRCGAPLSEGVQFCTQCGAQANTVTASDVVASAGAPPHFSPVAAPNTPPAAAPSNSGCRNLAIGTVVVLIVIAALGTVGAYFAYHSVKQKATAMLHGAGVVASAVAPHDSAVPAVPPQSASADISTSPSGFAPWNPPSSTAPGGPGPAPLKEGMLVVTAIADLSGDYESYKQITSINNKGVTLSYASEHPASGQSQNKPETHTSRTVLTQDLQSAHDYHELFGDTDPASFPGTTAISASSAVLAELKNKGKSQFSFQPDGLKGAASSLLSALGGIAGVDPKNAGGGALGELMKGEQCTLQRDGNTTFAFPILLNNQPATLPAVHATCATDDGVADFYLLDQADDPLMLSWKLGSGSHLQVVKITYPETHPQQMEEDLAKKKKVLIYGIYFDFASDRLKPESTPVFKEIADVMQRHTDWKLAVGGHTDNIGGDTYNLPLSKRRAAAVKQELVTHYGIAADRLTTDGYGASRPVDRNDTLEGRARNRRVELTREDD
jgi:outer membrane protein OmpA-like peptidoglycan-associated protein